MIPHNVKSGIHNRVNEQLQREEIPPVDEAYILNRMEIALMGVKIRMNKKMLLGGQSNDVPGVMAQVHEGFQTRSAVEGKTEGGDNDANVDGMMESNRNEELSR